MKNIKIGFIGLGNVGSKLAGSILRNGFDLTVNDLNRERAQLLIDKGAKWGESPKKIVDSTDMIITCLPSPKVSAKVMEDGNGILKGISYGKVWLEMSTTDEKEVKRLGELVKKFGGEVADCPVSGGCHRAATGNISIFVGGERKTFDKIFPVLKFMGRSILHTGGLGSASKLKVITNFLATANLVSICEALITARKAGLDLKTTYEAIRISSGNSFVHETESQVILNGSRDINFTMDLVLKDIGIFQSIAESAGVPLEISPMLIDIFKDGERRYGAREWSSNIVRRLEDACRTKIIASGFPDQIVDNEREEMGEEVVISN